MFIHVPKLITALCPLLLIVSLAACTSTSTPSDPSRANPTPLSAAPADPTTSEVAAVTTQKLIEAIAQTEVDLQLKSQQYTQNSPQIVQLQTQKQALQDRLAELAPQDWKMQLNQARKEKLETAIAMLEVDLVKHKTKLQETHPKVAITIAKIQSLKEAHSQIQ